MEKILIVEDDEFISDVLYRLLSKHGYQADQAYSGTEAMRILEHENMDLILLDLMLPGMKGEEILKMKSPHVPIIVISAKTESSERIEALKLGADDYIQKPFDNEEVLLRISAVLRRFHQKPEQEGVLTFLDLKLDPKSMMVYVKDKSVDLTNYEFQILQCLMENPTRVYTKKMIYEKIWGYDYMSSKNVINIHISNIRKKLKELSDKEYIKTLWGLGIKMNEE